MGVKSGVDLMIDGHVPLGAGLSSSAALECSVATAMNHLFDMGFNLEELARLTQKAENQYVGVPCRHYGSICFSYGNNWICAIAGTAEIFQLAIFPLMFASHGLELLIIDTQAHHALTDGGYAERRASCESVAAKLAVKSMRELTMAQLDASRDQLTATEYIRARHAVGEMKRVLDCVDALSNGDFVKVGQLINESHCFIAR